MKTSKLPKFIGCRDYGQSHRLLLDAAHYSPLPMIYKVKSHRLFKPCWMMLWKDLPDTITTNFNWPILPVSHISSIFPSPSHFQMSPIIKRVTLTVVYHFLCPVDTINPSLPIKWFIVLGVGSHNHSNLQFFRLRGYSKAPSARCKKKVQASVWSRYWKTWEKFWANDKQEYDQKNIFDLQLILSLMWDSGF